MTESPSPARAWLLGVVGYSDVEGPVFCYVVVSLLAPTVRLFRCVLLLTFRAILYEFSTCRLGHIDKDAVRVTYVAHDVSRLIDFHDGCTKEIEGIPFEFRFMTYVDLLNAAGGIDVVIGNLADFNELIHQRISRLPDAYTLKRRYQEITGLGLSEKRLAAEARVPSCGGSERGPLRASMWHKRSCICVYSEVLDSLEMGARYLMTG